MDRSRGLLRLRHLQEATEARGEEIAAERGRFQRLAHEDQSPRAVSAFNLFQTPPAIADRMIAAATEDGRELGRVLEPSAGLGRLYQAIRRADPACMVHLVEIEPALCAELWRLVERDENAILHRGDFLEPLPVVGGFDSIVMNPPFRLGRDVQHIERARLLLRPGGRLVALCYDGAKQNARLRPVVDRWEVLPAGSFKSEGTGAGVALAVIDGG